MMRYYAADDLIIRSMVQSDCAAFSDAFRSQGWEKPVAQFERYYSRQEDSTLAVLVATKSNAVAGYALVLPQALTGPFAFHGIPEIMDFNVLIKYQRMGIGSTILDIAEKSARKMANAVCLGVGLHSGYGTAQRMYIKRGYIPDGSGVWYNDVQLTPDMPCRNDDDLVLYLKKDFM